MPNWCTNHLTISGDPKEMSCFEKKLKTIPEYYYKTGWINSDYKNNERYSFSAIVPIPEEILQNHLDMNAIFEKASQLHNKAIQEWRENNPEKSKIMDDAIKEVKFPIVPDDFPQMSLPPEYNKEKQEEWYHWHSYNWGTKWDVEEYDSSFIEGEKESKIIWHFDTAWVPPLEWIRKASELYPDLNFHIEYKEPGMNFRGESIAEQGTFYDDYKENNMIKRY